ncbi:VOC family protein [Acidocella sp.]|uniref:VOC family protein n=1 Tax=Acidocella sp. TaxID=50710 RepID=UPI0026179E4A|nr:VOC family protein [Acidocella sp.]
MSTHTPAAITMTNFKLVVGDLAAAERFYTAMGMKPVSRNTGGDAEVRQTQCWMSETGGGNAFTLILTQFLALPPPRKPVYPGEIWLVFTVPDVDAMVALVAREGGSILRPGENILDHNVRAAVVADPEGHPIELVGPLRG